MAADRPNNDQHTQDESARTSEKFTLETWLWKGCTGV